MLFTENAACRKMCIVYNHSCVHTTTMPCISFGYRKFYKNKLKKTREEHMPKTSLRLPLGRKGKVGWNGKVLSQKGL